MIVKKRTLDAILMAVMFGVEANMVMVLSKIAMVLDYALVHSYVAKQDASDLVIPILVTSIPHKF